MLSSAKTAIDVWRLVGPGDVVVQRAGSTLRHASSPPADKRAAVEARKEAEAKRIRRTAQPVAASWIAGLLWNSVFSFPLPSFLKLSLRRRPRTPGLPFHPLMWLFVACKTLVTEALWCKPSFFDKVFRTHRESVWGVLTGVRAAPHPTRIRRHARGSAT